MKYYGTLLILGTVLSACTVTDDPSEGGLLGGVYGLGSGAYDKRVAERDAHLADLKAAHTTTQNTQEILQEEKADHQTELAILQQQSQHLHHDIEQLHHEITQVKFKTKQAQQQQKSLLKRQQKLAQRTTTLQQQLKKENSKELDSYRAEEQRLLREIDELREDLYLLEE